MRISKRLNTFTKSRFQRWFPPNTPARLLLFFIITAVFSLISIPAGLFTDNFAGMHNIWVALCFVPIYAVTLALTFAMAKPDMESKLQHHRRKLLVWTKVIAISMIFAFIVMVSVMIPWIINNDMMIFGKIKVPPATSDHIALTYQANQALLNGHNPYTHTNIITAMDTFPTICPTYLRQGDFADVYPSPSEEQYQAALAKARTNPEVPPLEFESKLNYPAGAFIFRAPLDKAGGDPQDFYLLCILIMTIVLVWKAPKSLRPLAFIGCGSSVLVWLSHFYGATESLYILPLFLGWTLRKRLYASSILMGFACACKQTAWFFIPFYLILLMREAGWRKSIQSLVIIGAAFTLVNLPFIVADPRAWASGVMAPMLEPLYPAGIGIASFATLSSAAPPQMLFTAFEIIAVIVCLKWYYRNCRKAPHTGLLLAIVPLFFAWRSMFAYFIMIPLLVFGVVLVEEYKNFSATQTETSTTS